MKSSRNFSTVTVIAMIASLSLTTSRTVSAHCDTMDGPVIKAARRALDMGNVNLALIWVQPGDEAAIQTAFEKARAARKAGESEKEIAEQGFFETFVRIHREGEGAPYTGIKPAGTPIDPGVRAADHSLESGSVAEVQKLLVDSLQSGLDHSFQAAQRLRGYSPDDVVAGRNYVKAYVAYTHFVEGIHQAIKGPVHQHEVGEHHADHGAISSTDHGTHSSHGGHIGHLPWILVIIMGLGLVGETLFLVIRRGRHAV